eukprot:scaffold628_cov88-Skeletonema_dohrnii-CCMP3373.AAC.2
MKLATATTAIAATAALRPSAFGCSRVLENKYDTVVAGRSMVSPIPHPSPFSSSSFSFFGMIIWVPILLANIMSLYYFVCVFFYSYITPPTPTQDWSHQFYDYLLIHPKGQEMDGGSPTGSNSIQWKSTYGSVVSSIVGYMEYKGMGPGQVCEGMDIDVDAASDGMNEAGLGAHMLYLGEEDGTAYAEPSTTEISM